MAAPAISRSWQPSGPTAARAAAFRADITDEIAVTGLVEQVRAALRPIAVLVLNATGPRPTVPAVESTGRMCPPSWTSSSRARCCWCGTARPTCARARAPRIVHVGSDVVDRAPEGNAAYVAAETAQLGPARVQARELAPLGITVNTAAPAGCRSSGTHSGDPRALEAYRRHVPLGRTGTPGDVAAAVSFPASEDATFIPGARLHITGGSTTG
ncbi:SDR family NAD(P)-dependent oxidoreductase [Geodermatophilus sp. SYSU D00758]